MMNRLSKRTSALALLATVLTISLSVGWMPSAPTAEPPSPSPSNAASDPVKLGIMEGYPLPPDRQVTLQNWLAFPKNRWAFRHMQALFPTGKVMRSGTMAAIPQGKPLDLDRLTFTDKDGKRITAQQYFDRQYVDAFLVLHKGKIVYEG